MTKKEIEVNGWQTTIRCLKEANKDNQYKFEQYTKENELDKAKRYFEWINFNNAAITVLENEVNIYKDAKEKLNKI